MKIYIKKVKNVKGQIKESLWIAFTHNNKRHRKSLGLSNSKANYKLAQTKLLPQMMLKLHSDEFFNKPVPKLSEYALTSFEMNKAHRRATTQNDYLISFNLHIKPYLGHMRLDTIKSSDLKLWQNKVLESVSPRRLRNIRAVLSGILKDAMVDEYIGKNPLTLVKTVKAQKVKINPFAVSEIAMILDASTGQSRNFFALAFLSGMRSGEMIGLKWSDINFFSMEIKPERSRKMGNDGALKTESSYRVIEILDSLLPYLKEQFLSTGDKNSYVFLNPSDKPLYDIKRIRDNDWKKTLKACELEYRPIYHTRHTFATMMLENGEDILWLSSMLGHTDSSMTLSKYTHYVKKKDKKRGQFLKKELTLNRTENDTEFLKVGLKFVV